MNIESGRRIDFQRRDGVCVLNASKRPRAEPDHDLGTLAVTSDEQKERRTEADSPREIGKCVYTAGGYGDEKLVYRVKAQVDDGRFVSNAEGLNSDESLVPKEA